jgi:hypothetical protein
VGTGGGMCPPIFFKGQKVPSFFYEVPFLYKLITNVAVNAKLTSKVPFLFGNFNVFKKKLVKNVQFRYGMTGKFFCVVMENKGLT